MKVKTKKKPEKLIMLIEKIYLKQVLPLGTIIWQKNKSKSILNLIFLSFLL